MLKALKSHIIHAHRMLQHALRDGGTIVRRSGKWPEVEREFLTKNPTCAACGGKVNLNAHHIKPFHLDPAAELDPTNLITLCMERDLHCHLLIGHGNDFQAFNPDVVKMAALALVAHQAGDQKAVLELETQAKCSRQFGLTPPKAG
jgi:hypothetical protein